MKQAVNIQIQGLDNVGTPSGSSVANKASRTGAGKADHSAWRETLANWQGLLGESQRLKALSFLMRQMAIMVQSGTPLLASVQGLQRQIKDAKWQQAIGHVQHKIEEGQSLAEGMRQCPRLFDGITVALIAAGEQSGRLPEMLTRLAELANKQLRVRNGIVGALIYPILLMAIVSIVFVVTLVGVVPRFETMFQTLQAPLPMTTQILVWLSHGLQDHWWWLLPAALVGVLGGLLWITSAKGQLWVDRCLVRLPILGALTVSVCTARMVRLMAELIDSHLPLLEVLGLVKATCSNHLYAQLLDKAEQSVMHGESMSHAFANTPLIPDSVHEAIRSGEASGRMSQSMLTLADFLEEDNEQMIKSLTTLLEPAILLFLGVVVGALAISLFLPLFDLSAIAGEAVQK